MSNSRIDIDVAENARRPAAFFDRDGVLNEDAGFVHRPDQFVWMPEAIAAVRLLNENGYLVFVVTNQSGVARGFYTPDAVDRLHFWMNQELARGGAHVDAFAYCPHHPDGSVREFAVTCACRKPAAGLLEDLMARWPVDRAASFLIGDRETDLQAATSAGLKGVLYQGGALLPIVRNLIVRNLIVRNLISPAATPP